MSNETRACEYESPGYCRTHGLPLTAAGECPAAPLAPSEAGGRDALENAVRKWFAEIAGTDSTGAPVVPLNDPLDVLHEIKEHFASRPSSGEDSARQDARDDFFSAIVAVAEAIDTKEHGPNRALHRRSLHAVAVPLAAILRAKALCEANDRAARAAEGSANG